MNQFLHLLETLDTHIDQIHTDLGADWPEFVAQVQSLTPAFEATQDETALARAVGDLYMVCRAREPVLAILRRTADTSNVGHDRRPLEGGADRADTIPIRDIVNRFQSLLARLEEMESLKEDRDRQSPSTAKSGGDH